MIARELVFLEGPCRPIAVGDQVFYPVSTYFLAISYPSSSGQSGIVFQAVIDGTVCPDLIGYITPLNQLVLMGTLESGRVEYDPNSLDM
ncbi:MAG: hypothetical protein S4CHLAM102_11960 [Chlamydiia bacterium]|nr:hypothetical protein [Chlamydiia bacterium]